MIYELINDFEIDLLKCPKRLGNLSSPIQFDECLPLERSGFRCRKNLKVERIIPHHSVVQLSEYFAQNWPLGLAEETVPKLAMMFKEVLGVVATPYSPGQPIGMVKVDRREVAVGRFKDQRDEGQPQLVTLAVVGALPSFPSITSGRTGCTFRRASEAT